MPDDEILAPTDVDQAILALLACEDLDCVAARETVVRLGAVVVGPLCAILDEGLAENRGSVDVPDALARRRAAAALGDLRDDRAVDPLRRAVRGPDPLLRAEAAGALGRIDPAAHGDALADLLNDPDPLVRETVARALTHSGRRDLLPALRDAKAKEAHSQVQLEIERAIRAIEGL